MTDPVAAADAVVAAIGPGVSSPGVKARDVVLVAGPWLAGVSSLIAALRDRMPERTFVETDVLGPAHAPTAVVFAVSAIASVTESDCALIDLAAKYTDLIIGVVTKCDAHRNWRDVLAANRARLVTRARRYEHVQWVGAAAAPDLGEPKLDELVGVLRRRLADPATYRRNRLRAWEVRLNAVIERHRCQAADADRQARVAALRKTRDDIARGRRLSKSERNIALRSQIQQVRVQLTYFARNRCTSLRAQLQEDASNATRRRLGEFESNVCTRAGDVADQVDQGITRHLVDVATELGLSVPKPPPSRSRPEVSSPRLKARRLETQLTMVLGAGFGFGVALAITRLFAGIAAGLTIAGAVAGGVVGLALMMWVVGIRGLLHDRAALDRWVTDVTAALRCAVEERVATGVLAAEISLTSELVARDEMEVATAADRIAEIDAELREHAAAAAKAATVRDRRLPSLQKALEAVHAELYG